MALKIRPIHLKQANEWVKNTIGTTYQQSVESLLFLVMTEKDYAALQFVEDQQQENWMMV